MDDRGRTGTQSDLFARSGGVDHRVPICDGEVTEECAHGGAVGDVEVAGIGVDEDRFGRILNLDIVPFVPRATIIRVAGRQGPVAPGDVAEKVTRRSIARRVTDHRLELPERIVG